jgi:hypothetical protein
MLLISAVAVVFILLHLGGSQAGQTQGPVPNDTGNAEYPQTTPQSVTHKTLPVPVINNGGPPYPVATRDLLRPYQLLKDPFKDKGKMVIFIGLDFPILANGTLATYQSLDPRIAKQAGVKGLRFDRMISEAICLYDIMGVEVPGSSSPQMIGELAVAIKPGEQVPDDTRPWAAEPLGIMEGTNGFGAAIQIPAVRFWNYAEAGAATQGVKQEASVLDGDSLTAVNLVKSRIKPKEVLLALNPDLPHAKWEAVNNESVCHGCWYVSAHIRKNAESTADVQYYENPGWQVNVVRQTVQPNVDAARFYSSTGVDVTP